MPAGSKVRLTATLAEAEELGEGAVQATIDGAMHREGSDKPVCVAQMVFRYFAE